MVSAHRAPDAPASPVADRHDDVLGETPEGSKHRHTAFADDSLEGRRLFAEVLGTFLLVLAAAGGPVVEATQGGVGPVASVTAPGLTVLAVILFMGKVSGAHLNPAVSIAFALRRDFPWRRVPGYAAAQLTGASLACLTLQLLLGDAAHLGASRPGTGITDVQAFVLETILTTGLISTILGTASKAQNVGPLSALGVSAYIVLAGLWAGPVSGASMNPARSFGPDLVHGTFTHFWPYTAGPLLGAIAAIGIASVLRGPGGGHTASTAAQGTPLNHRHGV